MLDELETVERQLVRDLERLIELPEEDRPPMLFDGGSAVLTAVRVLIVMHKSGSPPPGHNPERLKGAAILLHEQVDLAEARSRATSTTLH